MDFFSGYAHENHSISSAFLLLGAFLSMDIARSMSGILTQLSPFTNLLIRKSPGVNVGIPFIVVASLSKSSKYPSPCFEPTRFLLFRVFWRSSVRRFLDLACLMNRLDILWPVDVGKAWDGESMD